MRSAVIDHPSEVSWENRLLGVIAATLTVFGIASEIGRAHV